MHCTRKERKEVRPRVHQLQVKRASLVNNSVLAEFNNHYFCNIHRRTSHWNQESQLCVNYCTPLGGSRYQFVSFPFFDVIQHAPAYFINGSVHSCSIKYSLCNLHAWEIWIFYRLQNNIMRRQLFLYTYTFIRFSTWWCWKTAYLERSFFLSYNLLPTYKCGYSFIQHNNIVSERVA